MFPRLRAVMTRLHCRSLLFSGMSDLDCHGLEETTPEWRAVFMKGQPDSRAQFF